MAGDWQGDEREEEQGGWRERLRWGEDWERREVEGLPQEGLLYLLMNEMGLEILRKRSFTKSNSQHLSKGRIGGNSGSSL